MLSIIPRGFMRECDIDWFPATTRRMHQRDLLSNCWPLQSMEQTKQDLGLGAEVQNTDKEFQIRMDLRHFTPEEVKITCQDGRISVHARHEEEHDKLGFMTHEISRSYKLPQNIDEKSATSSLNPHGVLNIKIQKLAKEEPEPEPKEVDIHVEFKSS